MGWRFGFLYRHWHGPPIISVLPRLDRPDDQDRCSGDPDDRGAEKREDAACRMAEGLADHRLAPQREHVDGQLAPDTEQQGRNQS